MRPQSQPLSKPGAVFLRGALLIALSTTAASAQAPFTSPRGFLATEGDSSHFVLFSSSYERFMQIDDTWRGQTLNGIRSIGFRRDGARPGGSARTMIVSVNFGLADWSNRSTTFAANWRSTPTNVVAPRTINLPDWSAAPASAPAAFDVLLPFDVPFDYDGSDAFAFEILMTNVSAGDVPAVDRELGRDNAYAFAAGTLTTTGCVVGNNVLPMGHQLELRNFGPSHPNFGMQFAIDVTRAPANQVCVLNLAASPANLSAPGLCTTVQASPPFSIPLGATDALGDILGLELDIPYIQAYEGLSIVSQAFALDPASSSAIPIAISNDRNAAMPAALRPSPRAAYLYTPLLFSPTANAIWNGRAVIARLSN